MAEVHDAGYLSIGEVLGLLLEEFPDVTISKIRFLESQGLISPERTASGYRKFYDPDVELLRVILTEQRSNYLPLRVIKDRLETGEIDPTGEHLRPNGDDGSVADEPGDDGQEQADEVPSSSVAAHPAARRSASDTDDADEIDGIDGRAAPPVAESEATSATADPESTEEATPAKVAAQLMPGVLLDRTELCSLVGMTDSELDQLENFGIVVQREGSSPPLYGDEAIEIAQPACELLRAGVDARHLRTWRTSAEREASLYEQLVTPRFRQRNPESHAEALAQLQRLDALGGDLRAAMTKQALRRHFES
ncbi:MerR family transcriptional regulator [Ilumatobacter sp.]|uniref:MerR family transcriptional regulator n=1 Tax=Ilumatobacter sp. TaxID=1967498 RepID=UPI003AF6CD07